MAERGDVLQLKRRVGYRSGREEERVVVVQATALNATLPTVVIVPLDGHVALFVGSPLVVRVSAAEAGATADHVAIASSLAILRLDRALPGRVGRLDPATQHELDERLRFVLDL
jgi:mRNA-degrading endonuclease toxin of MazEF toxin-antitoxin module